MLPLSLQDRLALLSLSSTTASPPAEADISDRVSLMRESRSLGESTKLKRDSSSVTQKDSESKRLFTPIDKEAEDTPTLCNRPKRGYDESNVPKTKKIDPLTEEIVVFEDGSVYTGTLNEEGDPHGKGFMRWPDGESYDGDFENGLYHGKGHQSIFDQELGVVSVHYHGEMREGFFHGQGRIEYREDTQEDFVAYEAVFTRGLIIGNAKVFFKNGDVYEGPMDRFQPHGKGVLKKLNGTIAKVKFVHGKMRSILFSHSL